MEAQDIRCAIDDDLCLAVTYNFRRPKSKLIRYYSIDRIPVDVMAHLNSENER